MKARRKPPKKLQRYGIVISYDAVFGRWPRMEDLEERLGALNRSDAILLIAWCSAVTRSWARVPDNTLDKRVRAWLFPFWNAVFEKWTTKFGEGFLFSRYSLLWLLRKVFSNCPANGPRVDTFERLKVFGEACLIANDLSAFPSPKPLPTDLAIAANILPQTEYCSQEDYDRDMARTQYLLTNLAPNAEGTPLPAFSARLQDLLGHSVTEYCDLAFASAMKPIDADTEAIEHYRVVAVAPQNFTTTSIAPAKAEQFLDSIAVREQDVQRMAAASGEHASDFTLFRDRPFLRRGAEFVPLDLGFVLDKAGRSLFWTALKSCPSTERETLLQHWGELFDLYVSTLLASSLTQDCTFLARPRFADDAEASDGAVREGRTLILLEYKASTISSAIKYADDPAALERVLESRFVQGDGHGRKGLAQLSHAIKRFADGHTIRDTESGTQIHPKDIQKIIPVLVHLDNTLRTPGIPHYMSVRFKGLGRVKRFTVTPVVLMPITELEELEGYLETSPLSPFLESFLMRLRTDKSAVFLTPMLPMLDGKARKNGKMLERFDRYVQEMLGRLFPNAVKSRQ